MAAIRNNSLFLAIPAGPAQRCLNPSVAFGDGAPDKRVIAAVKIMRGKHFCQALMRAITLGGQHHARCILVEPVHNARTHHPADPRQAGAAMRNQRVDQRAIGLARGRMNNKARRFVDDDQMRIFKQDIQWNILSLRRRIAHRWQDQPVFNIGAHGGGRVDLRGAGLKQAATLDQSLDTGARQRCVQCGIVFKSGGKESVNAHAAGIWRGGDKDVAVKFTGHGASP